MQWGTWGISLEVTLLASPKALETELVEKILSDFLITTLQKKLQLQECVWLSTSVTELLQVHSCLCTHQTLSAWVNWAEIFIRRFTANDSCYEMGTILKLQKRQRNAHVPWQTSGWGLPGDRDTVHSSLCIHKYSLEWNERASVADSAPCCETPTCSYSLV